jgi:hypothetical protein
LFNSQFFGFFAPGKLGIMPSKHPFGPVVNAARPLLEGVIMCRNIKTLFNFEPPATEQEIQASSLQFVRKLSGFTNPSKANQTAFDRAVEDVAAAARTLIGSLVTTSDPRDREIEAARAKAKSAARFGRQTTSTAEAENLTGRRDSYTRDG